MDKGTIRAVMDALRITQRELAGVCGLRTETVNRKLRNPRSGDIEIFQDGLRFLADVRRYELDSAMRMLNDEGTQNVVTKI